ncbi:MAG TPA: FhaA domain-containing protein [Anaerolineaceae bacterium]|nr:FhaA domain-containing protein [Anaerolineaceae bacterium]
MKSQMDLIESRLRAFIEGSLVSVLPWANSTTHLAQQLVQAMRDNLTRSGGGATVAPNQYTILVHPSRLSYWQTNPRVLDELADTLNQAANEAGVRFPSIPFIRLATDPNLSVADVSIRAAMDKDPVADTAVFETENQTDAGPEIPLNAFLIVNGVRMVPLNLPVINIGRRRDNQLVIDDPRVSRVHAQLRAVRGRYSLFDLNSSGGTYVNGQRITRMVLKPGDVISLAGVPVIYGQDVPSAQESADSESDSLASGSTSRIPSQSESEPRKDQ